MRHTTIAVMTIALVGGAGLYAAETPAAGTSALISDLKVQANDSPLVRAAKMAAANRASLTVHASRVIDNASLRSLGGHIAVANANQSAALPSLGSYPQQYPADPTSSGPSAESRAQIQQRINNLRVEQGVMAEEADQPYGGLYNEDQVTRRMTEIPQQLNQLQNQLTPPPPPSSPTRPPQ
jgi:hypothetical protein